MLSTRINEKRKLTKKKTRRKKVKNKTKRKHKMLSLIIPWHVGGINELFIHREPKEWNRKKVDIQYTCSESHTYDTNIKNIKSQAKW